MSEHTPTPWVLDLAKGQILDTNAQPVCRATMLPNAEAQLTRIVCTVNVHEELVKALEGMLAAWRTGVGAWALKDANHALAKAREK